jgi:hypothetical protein
LLTVPVSVGAAVIPSLTELPVSRANATPVTWVGLFSGNSKANASDIQSLVM